MSDTVLVAIIGVTGIVIGALLDAAVDAFRARPATPAGQQVDATLILGNAVDIRELRILRALYGEPRGRLLDGYKDAYYRPSLDATVSKGWVLLSKGKYTLTRVGADFCWGYLKQINGSWKPPSV